MTLLHLLLLALIQGVTEFLPISSSAHLILLPQLTGTADQGQAIDVSLHVGTLLAVMIYFWRDVWQGTIGLGHTLTGRFTTPQARLFLLLCLATIPVVVFGLALKLTGWDDAMRSITVIGWAMLGFGIVLYWTDQKGAQVKTGDGWSVRDALIMGFWQAVALIPGTSRSGACITGARVLGYERTEAARLSMLMSIPTIIASGTLTALKMAETNDPNLIRDGAIAAGLSFVAALFALTIMMRLLRSVSFTPYVIYRVVLGLVLLGIAYL